MKLSRSLRSHLWMYLIIFVVGVLICLWLFQIMFLNHYYEWYKTKEMIHISTKAVIAYEKKDYESLMDSISFRDDVCVEMLRQEKIIYSSGGIHRGCIYTGILGKLNDYQSDFLRSGIDEKSYKLINERVGNSILIRAVKLDSNTYLFISTSLDPLDSSIMILKNQFIYVTIFVLILSFVISYYISKRISAPIAKINESAKKMASGDYNEGFDVKNDIKEINELSRTLDQTRNELSKTEKLRRELLANISHDLKTPLTMIRAYAEMVRDISYHNPEKRTENLNVIIEETERLNILVNDILELSKIQSGTMQLNIESFDLQKLVQTILKRYRIFHEEEQMNFIFDYEQKAMVKADKLRIEQVICNLLDNAIKYTGDDKNITVLMMEKDDTYELQVIDTGLGIAKKDISNIWEMYTKIDQTYSRKNSGSGIGLSIVKNILVAHNFSYGVVSKKGRTCFHFNIKKDE